MRKQTINLGFIGLGTVGCGALEVLRRNEEHIAQRLGARLQVTRAAVRRVEKPRPVSLEGIAVSADGWEVVNDPHLDIVVEVVGGVVAAREFVFGAVRRGKHVVTTNKELIAKYGRELFAEARERGVDVCFEGSVAGGIPIIHPLRESLAGNQIQELMGIVNGTTNYILTKMKREGMSFEDALREAQARGYAEANPTDDIEGHDAVYKLAILSTIAFDTPIRVEDIYREGISQVAVEDLRYADELGYEIKLLAIAKHEQGVLELRVHPALIPQEHPLAAVSEVFNAIFVRGNAVGDVMFYGQGAGALPTGSAVVGDILDIARNILHGCTGRVPLVNGPERPVRPMEEVTCSYYLRTRVTDRPGVLAAISTILGEERVSVALMRQQLAEAGTAEIVWVTHPVQERNLRRALARIEQLDVVREINSLIRVEALKTGKAG
ncbi:MAG TPA: homoserine dehydrogenase [Armatimonadetes bacterium]|nr:homoserine dehydrogenase [Armatimonadota bacterium]